LATKVSRNGGVIRTARALAAGIWMLFVAAILSIVVGLLLEDYHVRMIAMVAGATFAVLAITVRAITAFAASRASGVDKRLANLIGLDAAPCFTTDDIGQIGYQNSAAVDRFGIKDGATLVATLQDHFANPAAVLFRLQSRAANIGTAREDVVTRRGHTRLTVHRIAPARFLWRLEEFLDRSSAGRGAESLSLPMLVANKTGVVLFSNEAMRRLLGARPKRLDQVFNSQNYHSGEEVEVNADAGPVRAILAEVEGAGERREIYLMPVPTRSTNESMLADFEHVPVALMKFAADGTLIIANRAARDLLALDVVSGQMFHELFEGLGRPIADWMGDVLSERLPTATEVLSVRSAETEQFLQVSLRRSVDFGKPGILAVLNDATALKTLEAQFVQSQKMQAIGQLAGGIAHDFNNLLTAISGHCDLLLLRHAREDHDYADLVQIHQNANRAASLVGQLLALSRKQTLKPEQIDLQDVLSDMTHLLNRLLGEKVKMRLVHAQGMGYIRADKRKLEQVLMNLVVNARDAMDQGGTIRVETEQVHLAEDLQRDLARLPAGDYAVIRVVDTGCGIPADRLQKIFEPFFTTKRVGEGTGLGLSTAYGIVKQSGGFIFVDSIVGEGSTFQLYFPIHAAEPVVDTEPAKTAPRILMKQGTGVVLLVEDEAPVRAFASRALRMRGYTVLEAENAEDALKTLEDPSLEVDIFVTDVVMPGMDGPSWVRQALLTRPDVRVIFVSGYAEDCLTEGQARIPNSVFLPKPFSLNDLTTTVQGQLH
jgi:two-component system, cell cycle sensor histidine kinase and response regulator CckA